MAITGPKLHVLILFVFFFAAGSARPVPAQVQLPWVNLGDTNFEDGFAGLGWLLEEFPAVYSADQIHGSNGKAIPGSNSFTAYSTTTHIAFVSKKQILRGWIVFEAVQPLASLDLRLADGSDSRASGFGDLIVGPGLQWGPKKIGSGVFIQRAMFDVSLPTGTHSDIRPVNTGNHFVFLNPSY